MVLVGLVGITFLGKMCSQDNRRALARVRRQRRAERESGRSAAATYMLPLLTTDDSSTKTARKQSMVASRSVNLFQSDCDLSFSRAGHLVSKVVRFFCNPKKEGGKRREKRRRGRDCEMGKRRRILVIRKTMAAPAELMARRLLAMQVLVARSVQFVRRSLMS